MVKTLAALYERELPRRQLIADALDLLGGVVEA